MTTYRWVLRGGWVLLAVWLAEAIGETSDKPFRAAAMALIVELLVLGMVEMVCQAVREAKRL
jgi:hypothetical protein